ncbi:hypothetical protein ACIHFC_36985 [Streptomyces sp. NPDC052013]|uniref:hypothetical protein n=1 Tax=Streptomyces sp. NPDC052013 TaxID=3365679 RepID=UPI0037CDB0D2
MLNKGDRAACRAGVMRLQTVEDIDLLIGRLRSLRAKMVACPDETDQVRALVHACATMTGIWLDDLACRFADTGYSADDLFSAAWELLESLPAAPSGFESAADPTFFAALRDATAGMLARLWITGYLLGPVPTDAWPNGDIARALLRALEHHADDRTLTDDLRQAGLDPHRGQPE